MNMSTPENKTLWATTKVGTRIIKIYKNPQIESALASTEIWYHQVGKKRKRIGCPWIDIHPNVFIKPSLLDEILVHEFVHVLEYCFEKRLALPNPEDCTQYAMVIGKWLPLMLKELKQEEKTIPKRRGLQSKAKLKHLKTYLHGKSSR